MSSPKNARGILSDPELAEAVRRYRELCVRDGACLIHPRRGGYGTLRYRNESVLAHRAAYAVDHDVLRDGLVVRHVCDRRQCVEPTHLLEGSLAQNSRDMWERGRQPRVGVKGEANKRAVLTADLVATMRRAVRSGTGLREVARLYGHEYSTVRAAVTGKTWRHLGEPPASFPNQHRGWRSPTRTPAEVVSQARTMVAAGSSLAEIGAVVGLHRATVGRVLARESASEVAR
jgi:hypothetical protein